MNTPEEMADLDDLKEALDDSSEKNRNFLIAFFVLEFYLAVTVVDTSHLNLFLADSVFAFPFIELQVSLIGFFIMAPLVLVAFHYNLLFNLLEHCKTLRSWLYHPDNDRLKNFNLLHAFMFNIRAKYDDYPESPRSANYYLLNTIIIFMVSLSPLLVLVLILWHFASFQNLWISLWHLLMLLVSLALHLFYWLRLQKPQLLAKKYDHIKALYFEIFNNYNIVFYLMLVLVIALVRMSALLLALYAPMTVAKYMDLPLVSFIVPHINIEGVVINEPIPLNKNTDILKSLATNDIHINASQKLPNDIKLLPVDECHQSLEYHPTDLSERHLKLANLNSVILCNINLIEANLQGASMTWSIFSGHFDLADMSGANLSHSQIQQHSSLVQTTLMGADMSYLRANKVNFTMADLSKANIWGSELILTEFLQAKLVGSYFTLAQTHFTNFRSADFSNSHFNQTNLRGVDLRFAKNFDHIVMFENSQISDCYVDDTNVLKRIDLYHQANCDIYNSNLLEEGSLDQEYIAQLRTQFNANDSTKFAKNSQNSEVLIDRIIDIAQRSEADKINLSNLALTQIPRRVTALQGLNTLNLAYNHLDSDQLLTTTLLLELTALDFAANDAVIVPPEIAKLSQLVSLNLSTNQLFSLPGDFKYLQKLQKLNISDNLFSSLPTSVVQLKQLSSLNLRGNKLTEFPARIDQLSKLEMLSFANNQLSAVPTEIGDLTRLSTLDLSSNELLTLPVEIGNLHMLKTLDLNDNSLTELPMEIGYLSQLTELVVSINQLTSLPPQIGKLTQLPSLNLQSNLLESLPKEIVQLHNISELNLSDNAFETFPKHISEFKALRLLSLKGNALEVIPPEIGKLTTLRELDLGGTELSVLPDEIGQLTKLTHLYLQGNQLTTLPDEIGKLSNLNTLDLSGNKLTTWQPALNRLTQLTELALAYNRLTQLPQQIQQLSQLRSLKLESNQLTRIPEQIGELTQLLTLNLANNQLTDLPYETRKLQGLQTLYLNGNKFTHLPGVVGLMERLRKLNLANNQLTTLPQALGELKELKDLNLSGNQLTRLPGAIVNLPLLETLYVRGNKLVSPPQKVADKGLEAIRAWFMDNG